MYSTDQNLPCNHRGKVFCSYPKTRPFSLKWFSYVNRIDFFCSLTLLESCCFPRFLPNVCLFSVVYYLFDEMLRRNVLG